MIIFKRFLIVESFVIIFLGCIFFVILFDISFVLSVCYLDDICIGVNCCFFFLFFSYSLNVRVSLDFCVFLMIVYLEKF